MVKQLTKHIFAVWCRKFLATTVQGHTKIHKRGLIQPYKLYTWNFRTGNPFPPWFFPLIFPQPWCKYDINVIIWKPHVIGTSSYHALMTSCPLLFGTSVHVATHIASSLQRGKWWPQAHIMTLIYVTGWYTRTRWTGRLSHWTSNLSHPHNPLLKH